VRRQITEHVSTGDDGLGEITLEAVSSWATRPPERHR
jgi:hypothetical protein